MVQAKNEGYLGNNLIKRAGTETKYTQEQIAEYQKCSSDPCHFIENYTQIISLDGVSYCNHAGDRSLLLTAGC